MLQIGFSFSCSISPYNLYFSLALEGFTSVMTVCVFARVCGCEDGCAYVKKWYDGVYVVVCVRVCRDSVYECVRVRECTKVCVVSYVNVYVCENV